MRLRNAVNYVETDGHMIERGDTDGKPTVIDPCKIFKKECDAERDEPGKQGPAKDKDKDKDNAKVAGLIIFGSSSWFDLTAWAVWQYCFDAIDRTYFGSWWQKLWAHEACLDAFSFNLLSSAASKTLGAYYMLKPDKSEKEKDKKKSSCKQTAADKQKKKPNPCLTA